MIPFSLTNEGLTVIVDGTPTFFSPGTAQFNGLSTALIAKDWDKAKQCLTKSGAIADYVGKMPGFTIQGDTVLWNGEALPADINNRIEKMATEGKDPTPLMRFFARLQKNPSSRSVEQLFPFLNHQGIAIEKDGTFLAYKGVNEDLTDKHTGTVDNTPGVVNEMPRNKISDDPNHACHFGFHVGAYAYASTFASRIVICRVDPEHVVCIPFDCGQQKMRVCKYEVVGFYGDDVKLPDTTIDSDEFDVPEADAPVVEEEQYSLNRLAPAQLMEQTIADLRIYAKNLRIIGASKIPGGKSALIKAIIKARKR